MIDVENPYGLVITRKPPPPPPPTFVCLACAQTRATRDWSERAIEKPPLCRVCAEHWGKGFGWNVPVASRGERTHMQRLKAMTCLIAWEARNGAR